MVVAILVPQVLSITNDGNSFLQVDVPPPQTTDLVLAHAGRYCKSDNAVDGDLLPGIAIEMDQNTVEFCLCWAAIPLLTFSDEPQSFERNARMFDRLG